MNKGKLSGDQALIESQSRTLPQFWPKPDGPGSVLQQTSNSYRNWRPYSQQFIFCITNRKPRVAKARRGKANTATYAVAGMLANVIGT
jgi:hypothetical protein